MNEMSKADAPATPHDEGVFFGDLAAAMESLKHIVM